MSESLSSYASVNKQWKLLIIQLQSEYETYLRPWMMQYKRVMDRYLWKSEDIDWWITSVIRNNWNDTIENCANEKIIFSDFLMVMRHCYSVRLPDCHHRILGILHISTQCDGRSMQYLLLDIQTVFEKWWI